MHVPIDDMKTLGALVRATRKQQGLRMDDLAGMAGVGHVFVRDLERGKPTIQLGRVLRVLAELGVVMSLDVPGERSDLRGRKADSDS